MGVGVGGGEAGCQRMQGSQGRGYRELELTLRHLPALEILRGRGEVQRTLL